jgi:hypothetical protein
MHGGSVVPVATDTGGRWYAYVLALSRHTNPARGPLGPKGRW